MSLEGSAIVLAVFDSRSGLIVKGLGVQRLSGVVVGESIAEVYRPAYRLFRAAVTFYPDPFELRVLVGGAAAQRFADWLRDEAVIPADAEPPRYDTRRRWRLWYCRRNDREVANNISAAGWCWETCSYMSAAEVDDMFDSMLDGDDPSRWSPAGCGCHPAADGLRVTLAGSGGRWTVETKVRCSHGALWSRDGVAAPWEAVSDWREGGRR